MGDPKAFFRLKINYWPNVTLLTLIPGFQRRRGIWSGEANQTI